MSAVMSDSSASGLFSSRPLPASGKRNAPFLVSKLAMIATAASQLAFAENRGGSEFCTVPTSAAEKSAPEALSTVTAPGTISDGRPLPVV
jgi:hypothetical protein